MSAGNRHRTLKARRRWASKEYNRKVRVAKIVLDGPTPELSHLLSIRQECKLCRKQ